MKKFPTLLKSIAFLIMLVISAQAYSQSKSTATAPPDKEQIYSWTVELNKELGKFEKQLIAIRPTDKQQIKTRQLLLSVLKKARSAKNSGSSFSLKEAKRLDDWFRREMQHSIDECLSRNPGSECCFSCPNGSGYQHFWCRANCFVSQF